MMFLKTKHLIVGFILSYCIGMGSSALAASLVYEDKIFDPGTLKPIDSVLKVKKGDIAPDFERPSINGQKIRLSDYRGRQNVLLTFIPAAWTPICSDQWPGYNIAQDLFRQYDTTLIGISVDNIPTLFAWIKQMGGLWFDVVSDFWPHGEISSSYGVLRSDGTSERAIFIIDKQGIIQFAHVEDINVRPDLGLLVKELEKITSP